MTTYLGMLLDMTQTGPEVSFSFNMLIPRRFISCAGMVTGTVDYFSVPNSVRIIAQSTLAINVEERPWPKGENWLCCRSLQPLLILGTSGVIPYEELKFRRLVA